MCDLLSFEIKSLIRGAKACSINVCQKGFFTRNLARFNLKISSHKKTMKNAKRLFLVALLMFIFSFNASLALALTANFNLALTPNFNSVNFNERAKTVSAKDNWIRVQSKNFTLVGNASERDIRNVAARLEQFREVISRLLPKARFSSAKPMTVVVFKSDSSYKPYKTLYNGKPANIAGYFQPGADVDYITLTSERRADSPYATIFHELVHLMVENSMQTAPAWFNEGIAEYYSTFEMRDDDTRARIGVPIAPHVFTLRQKFIPLNDLFQVDTRSPLYNEKDKQSVFYAESWALMHYLLLGNEGARRPQLGTFINLISNGKAVEESFRQAFASDYSSMEKELRQYVKRDSYTGQEFKFNESIEATTAAMQVAPLTEAEALTILGDLLLHQRRLDEAEKHLTEALAQDKTSAMTNAALGMVNVQRRDFATARKYLEQASASDSKNHLVHYYYAYALSREGMDGSGLVKTYDSASLAKMRDELKKAIALAPNYAESYHTLAFIELIAGDNLDEGVRLIARARALEPGRTEYALILAQLQMRQQKFAAAQATLARAIGNNPEPQLLAQLQGLASTVKDYGERQAQYEKERAEYEKRVAEMSVRNDSTETATSSNSSSGGSGANQEFGNQELGNRHLILKRRTEGAQVKGLLTRIECLPKGVAWHFETADKKPLKFISREFQDIEFISYVEDTADAISCDTRLKKPAFVMLTYKPASVKGYDGQVAVIEFISPDVEVEN